MAGPGTQAAAISVLIPVFSAAEAGCDAPDARVAAVLTVRMRCCSELI